MQTKTIYNIFYMYCETLFSMCIINSWLLDYFFLLFAHHTCVYMCIFCSFRFYNENLFSNHVQIKVKFYFSLTIILAFLLFNMCVQFILNEVSRVLCELSGHIYCVMEKDIYWGYNIDGCYCVIEHGKFFIIESKVEKK